MQIDPAAVTVNFFDPSTQLFSQSGDCPEEDFSDIFRCYVGEAAMWRDYLLLQHEAAGCGQWNYARLDNCNNCRFKSLCPALSGTPPSEEFSI